WAGQLLDQRAEVRRFDLFEPTGAILGWIAPLIGIGADEGARRRLAVAEVDPIHSDDFIDDLRELASGLRPLHLRLPARNIELVDILLEHRDKDHAAPARVLLLIEPRQHAASMQPVNRA